MRVDHEAHVSERVLHLLSLVEPDAADDLVGDTFSHQRVFYRARLRVGPVQNRHHRLDVVRQGGARRPRDEVGFFELVAAAIVRDSIAALAVGPQVLVLAVPVLADHRRGRIQNHLGRAVISFELDDLGVAEVLLEVEDVSEIGAAPFVDRLIGVADDAEVAVDFGQAADEQVLRPVGVLVFVHHHVPELLRVLRSHALGLLEHVHRLEQQVVEIERVALLERVQIMGVDLRDLLLSTVPAGRVRHRVGAFHPILRAADPRKRGARLDEGVLDLQGLERLFHDGELIGRVVDDEVAGQSDGRRFTPEQAGAQRVKRRDPHAGDVRTEQRLDPRPHFLGGLVGEGDGENLVRLRMAVANEVRDPAGDDARLARPGAGENE